MCLFSGLGTWQSWEALHARPERPVLHRNARRPTVLHSKFGLGTKAQTWRFMFNQAIKSAHLVNVGGLRNASSLCDVFGCDGLVLEKLYSCPCYADTPHCACDIRDYAEEEDYYQHVY
mmetsp:Transcript_49648/g.153310  ORF Transcript_49648/g.153310 Transcript_49648/m.153310 type:complete len:118 (-) Transcript_49648:109-462(-)